MEKFVVEAGQRSPGLYFDPGNGVFEIRGRSLLENASRFYQPLFEWMQGYAKKPCSSTTLNIHLDYFNSSSAKCLSDLLNMLHGIHSETSPVEIVWKHHAEDEDMEEAGKDFMTISKVPFRVERLQSL